MDIVHVHALVLQGKLTEIRRVNIRSYLLKGLKEYFFPLARGIVSVHPLFSFVRDTKNERLFRVRTVHRIGREQGLAMVVVVFTVLQTVRYSRLYTL